MALESDARAMDADGRDWTLILHNLTQYCADHRRFATKTPH
ncbi:MAG: hypothetical protein ACJASD_000653 [Sphingomonas echinoides]|jgi:hypothetical protein